MLFLHWMVSCVHNVFSADTFCVAVSPLCVVLLRVLHQSCSSINCYVPIDVFVYFELL